MLHGLTSTGATLSPFRHMFGQSLNMVPVIARDDRVHDYHADRLTLMLLPPRSSRGLYNYATYPGCSTAVQLQTEGH